MLRSKAVGEQSWHNRIIEDIRVKYLEFLYGCLLVEDASEVVLAKKW